MAIIFVILLQNLTYCPFKDKNGMQFALQTDRALNSLINGIFMQREDIYNTLNKKKLE